MIHAFQKSISGPLLDRFDTQSAWICRASISKISRPTERLRVLKLARTIADLTRADHIQAAHLAKAIHLRSIELA